jgi:homoserine kinase type II
LFRKQIDVIRPPVVGVFTRVDEEALAPVVRSAGLGGLRALRGVEAGSVNSNFALEADAGAFFLRVYEEQDQQGAARDVALLEHLGRAGVPTPMPVVAPDGTRLFEVAGKPAAFFPWCAGVMRCQRGVTDRDAERVGAALARVHAAGPGAPLGAGRFGKAELEQRLDRIAASGHPALAPEAAPLRARLRAWVARRRADLPRGLVHGDLFRDNVLWGEDGRLLALLDFESASEGAFAYDLMVTVLAWCFGDALDLGLARALVVGYASVRPLSVAERDGLLAEGVIAALRFTITRITDYSLRAGVGPRVLKDWRRFAARAAALEALGQVGLLQGLGLET